MSKTGGNVWEILKHGGEFVRNFEKRRETFEFKKIGGKMISTGGDRRPVQEDQ